MLDQLVVGLHRHQFPRGHGECPGEEPGHAGEAYGAPTRVGACHPENKRDVRQQPVTRAEDSRSGGATLHVAVTAPTSGAGPEQPAEPRPRPDGRP